MSKLKSLLRQAGLSELACQFAAYIERIDASAQPLVAVTAGVLSETVSQGHVCLQLTQAAAPTELMEWLPADVEVWKAGLLASNVVGQAGAFTPLILTEHNQLYLYRHWRAEQDVFEAIIRRHQEKFDIDVDILQRDFMSWPSTVEGTDWQKVAVFMAMTQRLAIISGGPGTGKTTIVLQLIRSLLNQQADMRLALAAPTGKAAARLEQSVQDAGNHIEAKTLHRLLGITANRPEGIYSVERPLPVDTLIVDEASMIDLHLMARLLNALPQHARLVMLGDSNQLASVEAGAVFASLCETEPGFSSHFIKLAQRCDIDISTVSPRQMGLYDQHVTLQQSYRFEQSSLIGQLAAAVKSNEADQAIALLKQSEMSWLSTDEEVLREHITLGYQHFIQSVEQKAEATDVLSAFERFRVLTAIKQGPQSVESIARLMTRYLAKRGWRTQHDFYHGRPILITQNDYRQQLFNGDVGVVLQEETGALSACFNFDGTVRRVPLNRLPAHETAFAMTVHKSQGSEFDNVSVVLPNEVSPVLTRELLYTAITRAKQGILIHASESALRHAIQTRHVRDSGLSHLLNSVSD